MILPEDAEDVEEMKWIIFNLKEMVKDAERSNIGPEGQAIGANPDDVLRVMAGLVGRNWNVKRNKKPYFQGIGFIVTALLLNANILPEDSDSDRYAKLQQVTDRAEQIFKTNWILNKCITGEEGKSAKQFLKDLVAKLSAKVHPILKQTDFLEKFNNDEMVKTMGQSLEANTALIVGAFFNAAQNLFQNSTADLEAANHFLELFEAESIQNAVGDVDDMGILPYLVAAIVVEFRPEIEAAASQQNSLFVGTTIVGSQLGEHLNSARAQNLIARAQAMQPELIQERPDVQPAPWWSVFCCRSKKERIPENI